MFDLRRREFMSLLGAAAAWPLAARAQQPERMRQVGVLTQLPESDPVVKGWFTAFQEGLQRLGWEQGRNIRIEYRWAGQDDQRMRNYATELVRMMPDVSSLPAPPPR
jgi:putative ABC transport system substrate-binding protein